ncbi:MAG: 2-polyprenyl-6-methoxyphenol hydroxylase [Betaproteobacteria bacterium]|nr:2-polyprenyl-6-methoxyphenol hydroxylase [Betaproteobacteria bacterium]
MNEPGEIIVVGGGPVGSALALGLDKAGAAVTLLEARAGGGAEDDARTLALSHGSRLILERLGVWPLPVAPTPILEINVSQRAGFGRVELNAAESGVPALGYVVEYGALQRALTAALAHSGVRIETACTALAVESDAQSVTVSVDQAGTMRPLHARLAAVADGGASLKLSPLKLHDYEQCALVCDVAAGQPHRNRAFERFTAEGPLALLPNAQGWALVWTARPDRAAALAALDEKSFCAQLGDAFGGSLGAFQLRGRRQVFPLRLKVAARPSVPRCVLIGNAAQTLHPVAGQGFNLGLRDAFEFARLFAVHGAADPGGENLLNAFYAQRRFDRTATILFTDSLIRLFSKDIPLLAPARGLGLAALSLLPGAKKFVARRMIFGAHG